MWCDALVRGVALGRGLECRVVSCGSSTGLWCCLDVVGVRRRAMAPVSTLPDATPTAVPFRQHMCTSVLTYMRTHTNVQVATRCEMEVACLDFEHNPEDPTLRERIDNLLQRHTPDAGNPYTGGSYTLSIPLAEVRWHSACAMLPLPRPCLHHHTQHSACFTSHCAVICLRAWTSTQHEDKYINAIRNKPQTKRILKGTDVHLCWVRSWSLCARRSTSFTACLPSWPCANSTCQRP